MAVSNDYRVRLMTARYRFPNRHSLAPAGICFVFFLLIPGCSYDGWLMQMDSNNPSPFFGLGFSVDSGSRPGKPGEAAAQDLRLKNATMDQRVELASVGTDRRRSTSSMQLAIPEGNDAAAENVDLRLSSF